MLNSTCKLSIISIVEKYNDDLLGCIKSAKDFVKEFVDDMVEYWDSNLTKLFRKKRDIQIADAVIELFKRRGDLENFNKKALYIMIREMTDVKTQHITKVVNQMKSHYLKISENYYETGSFSGKKIDISQIL